MNIKYLIKKSFFNWFGKAKYDKGLKEFDEDSVKEFSEYVAKKTPYSEFISVEQLYKVLEEDVIPDEVIRRLYETITGEGWYFFKGYFRLLQKSIEKRLVYSDITDREWLVRRVEHGVYDRIFAYEDEIRDKFKLIQEKEADQRLDKKVQ